MYAELVLNVKALHGECPVWDDKKELLYWIDGMGKKIHQYNPKDNKDKYIDTNQFIGCIGLTTDGGLITAMHQGIYLIDFNSGKSKKLFDPEKDNRENRFNDGKCDPEGRFWAGTMYYDGSKEKKGSLYRIEGSEKIKRVVKGVSISNGIAWGKNNSVMYFIDSPTRKVEEYKYDRYSGNISWKRTAVQIPKGEGIPDGMTIDEEGMLWIAQWGGYKVSRWDPDNSKKIEEIKVPVKNVSSCTFGGIDLQTLYITTARIDTSKENLSKNEYSGGLFKYKTDVKGKKPNRFII